MDEGLMARFDAKWAADPATGCWIWTAAAAGDGYGILKLTRQRKFVYAHRLSYEAFKGPIPPGAQVCHKCDTPRCVNPDHLFVGSSHDNHVDMMLKGRNRCGRLAGERNPSAKLTQREVEKIRSLLAMGLTQRQIGRAFNVSGVLIGKIANGSLWSSIVEGSA